MPRSGREDALLGRSFDSASRELKKNILFTALDKLGLLNCIRCGKRIETPKELSVDHIQSWRYADDPVKAFFDLDNIGFSHNQCNSDESKPRRIAASVEQSRSITHCPQGHPYNEANTYLEPRGKRRCRECGRVRSRLWKKDRKEYRRQYYATTGH